MQSSEKDPNYMLERSDVFIQNFEKTLRELDEKEFNHHVNALITKILEKDKRLKKESMRYWREITSRQYKFDRSMCILFF